MNKKYLICDTNIWYGIADGSINPEILKDYSLVATGINIVEIAQTPMLVSNISLVKNCVKAIKENHKMLFHSNFYDHMISIFDEGFKPNNEASEKVIEGMERLLQADINQIPESNIINTQKGTQGILERKKSFTNEFNKNLYEEKKILQDKSTRDLYKKGDHTISNRRYVAALLIDYHNKFYEGDIKVSEHDPNWSKLDFFMRTWDIYTRKLDLQKDMKLDKNDFADLFNLVYVQPGFKYTTLERKWVSIFKQDPILAKYFIEI